MPKTGEDGVRSITLGQVTGRPVVIGGGLAGLLLVGVVVAWQAGLLTWTGTPKAAASTKGAEAAVAAHADQPAPHTGHATTDSVKVAQTQIEHVREEVIAVKVEQRAQSVQIQEVKDDVQQIRSEQRHRFDRLMDKLDDVQKDVRSGGRRRTR